MLVQAQVVAVGKRGDRQSSPSGTNPSRASPIGRRIGGYYYKTESFQRPRAEQHTHFREIRNSNFFGAPSPGGRSVREITSREETERPPEESTRQIPEAPPVPGTESPLETWLGRSNRSRADLAGTWTTRVQARRVPADPTSVTGRSLAPTCPNARPGGGRALVGNGETGRVQ